MINIKPFLEVAALILGLVNGLFLLWVFLRDKPKLSVTPIHPKVYQWWFRLPDGKLENGSSVKNFGFIAYLGINNAGLRPVSIDMWCLTIKLENRQSHQLHPTNLPTPAIPVGDHLKSYPVFGQVGGLIESKGRLESGDSISGMSGYIYKYWGEDVWSPVIKESKINGEILVQSVLGNRAKCAISFQEKSLEEIEEWFPGLTKLYEDSNV